MPELVDRHERASLAAMTHEQLVDAVMRALVACRVAEREVVQLREQVAERDRALEHWERAFVPRRPLGVQFPVRSYRELEDMARAGGQFAPLDS